MHILRGLYDTAEATLKALGEDADEVENIPVRAWVLSGRAIIDTIRGRSPKVALGRLASARDDSLHHAERLLCDGLEAIAHLQAGDMDRAVRVADIALANMTEHPPTMGCAYLSVAGVAETHLARVERSAAAGEPIERLLACASAACRAGRAFAAKTPIYVPRAFLLTGRLAMLSGQPRRARALWRRSLGAARSLDMPLEEALALRALAQAAELPEEQRQYRKAGEDILERLGARPWLCAAPSATELHVVAA
jgi:ATP/maltotriose-dependent transcriptional regulator MalT